MADKSKIEWTEATWNPTVGCSVISPGCTNCYAMKMAARIELMSQSRIPRRSGRPKPTHYIGTTQPSKAGPVWTGKLALAPDDILLKPLSWKRPRMIFVNSMSDLFHESVPDEWIDRIFAVMALCPQHTFQVLTKRAERMRAYIERCQRVPERIYDLVCDFSLETHGVVIIADPSHAPFAPPGSQVLLGKWPLPNVWLGISAEDQKRADERIPHLLETPAAVRFVSAEPLLGAIDFEHIGNALFDRGAAISKAMNGPAALNWDQADAHIAHSQLDWIIVGGESGPNARPMHPDWARSIRDQCQAAGVPYFFKQWGEWGEAGAGSHWVSRNGGHRPVGDGVWAGDARMSKVGKHKAFRLLDGREHNEMPERANG